MFCSQRPETRYANLQMPPSHYHGYDGTFTILLVFFHCTSSFCFPHFNSQLQPTDPFSVASLKDIPLWAITKEPNSSGQTVGSIRIHQHKICTIHKVTTIASNITAKQTECLITHRHQQTDWNYSCVCAAQIPGDDHAISAHILLSISRHPHAQLLQLPNVKVLMNRQAHIYVWCTNSNNEKPNNSETKSVQPFYPHQYK